VDFHEAPTFIEVKSVSFVEKKVGKFPDAPTERGVKHLKELIELRKKDCRAVVLFISPRSDTRLVTSIDEIDPRFGELLRKAGKSGVELYAYNCRVTSTSVSLHRPVPVAI
jgi:sugar fermentation stimulation protein A